MHWLGYNESCTDLLTFSSEPEKEMTNATSIALDICNGKYSDAEMHQFIAAINEARRRKRMAAKATFHKGQTVEFLDQRTGLTIIGVVTKICPNHIKVLEGMTRTWTVSPALLRAV